MILLFTILLTLSLLLHWTQYRMNQETNKDWTRDHKRQTNEYSELQFKLDSLGKNYLNLSHQIDRLNEEREKTKDSHYIQLTSLQGERDSLRNKLENYETDTLETIRDYDREIEILQSTISRLTLKTTELKRRLRQERETYRLTLETLRPTTIDSYQSIEIETLPTPEEIERLSLNIPTPKEIEMEFRKLDSFTKRQTRDLINE